MTVRELLKIVLPNSNADDPEINEEMVLEFYNDIPQDFSMFGCGRTWCDDCQYHKICNGSFIV